MDPSSPQTVLKGVAITSSLCGIVGGLYGGFKHGASSKFFMYSAVNSGIAAATFFSIREYVVSPVLVSTLSGRQYQLRKQRLSFPASNPTLDEPDSLSWTNIRTSRLLDSGISGGLAGGVLNVWKRGRRGLAPGLTTGALMCTLLQWCFNELNILRICYVSANSTVPTQRATDSIAHAACQSSPVEPSPPTATQPTPTETPTSQSLTDRILSLFGQRLSDEKYLERLKTERDAYLRRIAELEEKQK